jgi:hypothetical protein
MYANIEEKGEKEISSSAYSSSDNSNNIPIFANANR